MNTLYGYQQSLTTSTFSVWDTFISVIPVILGGIILFLIGILLARWAKWLVIKFLEAINLEKLTDSAGVDKYLKKAEVKHSFTHLIGMLVEWFIILIFFLALVDLLGLNAVSSVLFSVLGYIPNIIAAVLIFALGYLLANVVGGVVRSALVSIDRDIAKPLGNFARWIVILIATFAAIDQLKIAQGLVDVFFQGLTYTLVLVIGLSVGLGSKDLVSKILGDWYERIKK